MSNKKLLILYTKDPDEVYNRKSAIGSYVHCLADSLAKEFDVFVNHHSVDYLPENKANTVSRKSVTGIIRTLIPKRIKSLLREKKHFAALEDLKHKIKSIGIQYDFILEFYNFGSDIGLELAKYNKCPLNIIYDGPVFEEYEFFNRHKSWFEKKCRNREKATFERATHIVVYSQPMIDFCVQHIHAQKEKYRIHQNIDFSRFHFFEGEKDFSGSLNLCFIGSFLKWHRVDMLLKSYKKLQTELPAKKLHLYLVGDGMEKTKMEHLAKDLGLKDCTFTGYLDGDELIEVQKKMHIGIMPSSNWYGAPNKLFEYGAMKMAVVAPDTPTIKDLFLTEEICFIEKKNDQMLYTALVGIIQNNVYLSKIADNLHRKISHKYSAEITFYFYSNLMR